MDLRTLVDVLVFFALLSVSSVLAAGEFAFFRMKLESVKDLDDRRSRVLKGMLREPQELLINLLIGTSLANVLIVLFAVRIAWRAFPEAGRTGATAVSLLVAALLVAIFARFLPRIYVGHRPAAAALNLAEPVRVLLVPVYPLAKAGLVFTGGLLESKTFQVVSDDAVRVGGMARIDDLNESLRTGIRKGEDCATIAGLLYGLAGKIPAEGEEFQVEGVRLVVEKVRRRRIERVLVVADGAGRAARETNE